MPVNTQPLNPQEIADLFDKPGEVPGNTFEIALVLGGTVSAGAYTAGVLDFLIEAMDAWTEARDAPNGTPVPRHNVVLRFITCTSGGTVTAAIAARALAYEFEHVARTTPDEIAASNPFYDTWVNRLTLTDFLGTKDLDRPGARAISLLDGTPIEDAAGRLASFKTEKPKRRAYLADPLRLILTLTNLNGMPYRIGFQDVQLPGGGKISLAESYVNHCDYARFALVYPDQTLGSLRPDEFVLGFDNQRLPQGMGWSDFSQFALGSAAFPLGFPPRRLARPMEHYRYRIVAVPADTDPPTVCWLPLVPDWNAVQTWAGGSLPEDYHFVAVDGGATDNEPIELARTALAGVSGRNPRAGLQAKRAVVLVDPFAGAAPMSAQTRNHLEDLGGALIRSMIQQTRYDTRDLLLAANPDVYSRFMITAVRDDTVGDLAIATAAFGAFIGFACSAFRRHDYLLGRKNCQQFLRSKFVLPEANDVFTGCTSGVPLDQFRVTDPTGSYLPIIPLVGSAAIPEATDAWPRGKLDPNVFRAAIEHRFTRLMTNELAKGPLETALSWLGTKAGEGKIADMVIGAMKSALSTWKLD